MKRRQFTRFSAQPQPWPLTARSQQGQRVRRIGFLGGAARPLSFESSFLGGLLQGLRSVEDVR
jgi:hypothetical protein